MSKDIPAPWLVNNGQRPTLNAEQRRKLETLVANITSLRSDVFRKLIDPRRDINDECGYPSQGAYITVDQYKELYDREPIAARVVECLPKETWQVVPDVREAGTKPGQVTPFNRAWKDLGQCLQGDTSYYTRSEGSSVWEYLQRADILSGIGAYGVILLGLDDGEELWKPAAMRPSRSTEWGADALARWGSEATRKLIYMRVFPESLVQITQYDGNPSSPRYGCPVEYSITFNDPSEQHSGIGLTLATVAVHWTRVIHVADNLNSSEIFGIPRMRPVLNRLLDLCKLYSGSAEMYWRGAFPGLSLETNPQLGGDVEFPEDINDILENYMNGLQRYLAVAGVTAKTLAPTVVDPNPQITAQLEAICIKLGIPVRVFKGSERGELASTQDDDAWNDRLKNRQTNYVTPRIIVPVVDRLISLSVLPCPAKGYISEWPDITSQGDQERANVGAARTTALAQYVQGGVNALIPPQEYLTEILEIDPASAARMLQAAQVQAEDQAEGEATPSPLTQMADGVEQMTALFEKFGQGLITDQQLKETVKLFYGLDDTQAAALVGQELQRRALPAAPQNANEALVDDVEAYDAAAGWAGIPYTIDGAPVEEDPRDVN